MLTRNIAGIFERHAETSGTNHRAITAGKTPLRDAVPMGTIKVLPKQIGSAVLIQTACYRMFRVFSEGAGTICHFSRGRFGGYSFEKFGTGLASYLNQKFMRIGIDELCHRKVEVASTRAGAHRSAETGAGWLGTVHRNDQTVPPTRFIENIFWTAV
jgi:hypothetical protein